jgi:glycosyltransferase involved in cell wall biosynthesis
LNPEAATSAPENAPLRDKVWFVLKIAGVVDGPPPAEIARGLGAAGFAPHVASLRPGGLREQDLTAAGIPVASLGVSSLASAAATAGAFRLAAYIRRHEIRLVHTFDWPTTVYAVPAVRALSRGAMVLSSQRAHRELTPRAWRHALRLTDGMVDGIVVNCLFVRRHLMEDERVPADLLHVCYNGIDLQAFCPGPAERPAGLAGASAVIGTACALRPEKSLATLIEAFARIRPEHPGVKLLIVGDGPCLPDLQAQARGSGVAADCMFEPGTSQVPRWLRTMDIFVLPSRTEALSNSIMEAMACRCCVVASRVGGSPELITEDRTGVLFPCGDAASLARRLDWLLKNPPYRQQLAARGEQFLRQHFSLQLAVQRMGEIYSSLLCRV